MVQSLKTLAAVLLFGFAKGTSLNPYTYYNEVQEVLDWKPELTAQPPAANFTLPPRDGNIRFMAMHDMAGGYNDHSDIIYRRGFGGWDVVDDFCYFSHKFVAIPPVEWIDDGHSHDARVLGTFYLDWNSGQRLHDFFDNQADIVEQLAAMADFYKFDGWLINVEASVRDYMEEKGISTSVFLDFLASMKENHKENDLIQYYDSHNCRGCVSYQNELNERNIMYFDASGAILTNYFFSSLAQMSDKFHSSRVVAGDDNDMCFAGLDAWARGTPFSAGEMHHGVAAARETDISICVFAPGWTYENAAGQDVERWGPIEDSFWADIREAWTGK